MTTTFGRHAEGNPSRTQAGLAIIALEQRRTSGGVLFIAGILRVINAGVEMSTSPLKRSAARERAFSWF